MSSRKRLKKVSAILGTKSAHTSDDSDSDIFNTGEGKGSPTALGFSGDYQQLQNKPNNPVIKGKRARLRRGKPPSPRQSQERGGSPCSGLRLATPQSTSSVLSPGRRRPRPSKTKDSRAKLLELVRKDRSSRSIVENTLASSSSDEVGNQQERIRLASDNDSLDGFNKCGHLKSDDDSLDGFIADEDEDGDQKLSMKSGGEALSYNKSKITQAISEQQTENLKQLLGRKKQKGNLQQDYQDEMGNTVVHLAIHLSMPASYLSKLLDLWPKCMKMENDQGCTPTLLAAGNPYLLEILWETHPWSFDQITGDSEGKTVLHCAIESGSLEAVKFILSKCPHLANKKDSTENTATPLHYAAVLKHTQIVEVLMECGADPSAKDSKGWPPLLYADWRAGPRAHETDLGAVFALLRGGRAEAQLAALGALLRRGAAHEPKVRALVQNVATNPDFYLFVNELVRGRIELLESSFSFLADNSSILDMDNKMKWFRHRLNSLCQLDTDGEVSYPKVYEIVQPSDAWSSLMHRFNGSPDFALGAFFRGHITFQYRNSPNSSGPGVNRDAIITISTGMTANTYQNNDHVFSVGEDGVSHVPVKDYPRGAFKVAGAFYGHIIRHFYRSPLNLSPCFLKLVMGSPLSKQDLVSFDPEIAKSMQQLLDMPVREDLDDLFFEFAGRELCKHGSSRRVTHANKGEFADLVARRHLRAAMGAQAGEFRRGLGLAVPLGLLALFRAPELAALTAGDREVDADDWRRHAEVEGPEDQARWFWEVVADASPGDRGALLRFSTGAPCAPVGGFSKLAPPFKLQINLYDQNYQHLPTAATCFNTIQMPAYPSKSLLSARVLAAARYGSEGFVFA